MIINYLIPNNKLVQSFVERYLIFSSQKEYVQYTCYPNVNHCLGIVKNHSIRINNNQKKNDKIEFLKNNIPTHYTTGIYDKPMEFVVKGPYQEICIDIKPLGLSILGINNENSSVIDIEPFNHVNKKMVNKLYEIINEVDSVSIIEIRDALDSILCESIVDEIDTYINTIQINSELSLQELQQSLCMSNRSLYRFFTNKLKLTPYKYLEILKLQKCIQEVFRGKDLKSVGHEYGFTDSSHFNKFIKKYTCLSPTNLRSHLSLHNDLVLKN